MDFPVIFLWLISSLILLWSESRYCRISILLNLFRCVLWPRMWSILESVLCAWEECAFCCWAPLTFNYTIISPFQKATTTPTVSLCRTPGVNRVPGGRAGREAMMHVGTYLCSQSSFNSRTPEHLGPVRDAETAAASRQHLRTEFLSPSFLGPAHLRTSKSLEKVFLLLWSLLNISEKSKVQNSIYNTVLKKEEKTYIHVCLHGHKNIFGRIHKELVKMSDFKKVDSWGQEMG